MVAAMEESRYFRLRAARCRDLLAHATLAEVRAALWSLAREYELAAGDLATGSARPLRPAAPAPWPVLMMDAYWTLTLRMALATGSAFFPFVGGSGDASAR